MSKRIQSLSESPCFKCNVAEECMDKIKRSPKLMDICDNILGNAEFDYHNCTLFKAIMIDKEEENND